MNNDFANRIRVENTTQQIIKAVDKQYKKNGRNMNFKDKIALAVYNAILDVETLSSEEEQMKKQFLSCVNKYVSNLELEK